MDSLPQGMVLSLGEPLHDYWRSDGHGFRELEKRDARGGHSGLRQVAQSH